MDRCCLHHVEFGVQNGLKSVQKFVSQYGFKLIATRNSPVAKQWLLRTGQIRFLLTEITSDNIEDISKDPFVNIWFESTETSSKTKPLNKSRIHDSAFNIAIEVGKLESCVSRLERAGVTCCKKSKCHKSEDGEVWTATVESCVGNVKHTLVQSDNYKGLFLPGFLPVENVDQTLAISERQAVELGHVDHVTLVTEIGTSNRVLSWYEQYFGMSRFFINRDENEQEGFVIDGDNIGIRLMAFEYWKCAEMGLESPNRGGIKFVIAEALPGHGPNQVSTFLEQHNGPGIQHIGLHTNNIIHTVSRLRNNGVKFAEPPHTYFTEVGKLKEILAIGENVEILKENGILVDMEADTSNHDIQDCNFHNGPKHRYLMQKFTCPLFDRDTFFLEIIQRLGATGFGSGNITALWRSVQAYMASSKSNDTF